MKIIRRGFLYKEKGVIKVDHKKTNSVLLNKLQVDLLLRNRQYIKGVLLDAGCGEKPYSLIYEELTEKSIGCDVEYCIHNQIAVDVFATLDKLPFQKYCNLFLCKFLKIKFISSFVCVLQEGVYAVYKKCA